MKETKTIMSPNLGELGFRIQELVQGGWEIDKSEPLSMLGWQYQVVMVRTTQSHAALQKRLQDAIDEKPVLTRAEILAKARESKAEKQAQQKKSQQ